MPEFFRICQHIDMSGRSNHSMQSIGPGEIVSGESKRTGVTVNPGEDLVYMKSFRGLPGQWPYQRLAGRLQDSAQENELDI